MKRVLFLGTSAFAVPALEALSRLASSGDIEIAAVVTRPDRPGDRGRVTAPAAKDAALALGWRVIQPERLSGDDLSGLLALRAEGLVWAAYGALIPAALIASAGGRALNVHPSLLPRWRGSAPIAHAILAGDELTGVTLMEGVARMDAGPVVAQESTPIGPSETCGELEARLAALGARLLERELTRYLRGEIRPAAQDEARATWAPKLDPSLGQLRFELVATDLARLIRAYTPEPGAYTFYRGQRLGVLRASATVGENDEPGRLRVDGGVPLVATGDGWLRLDQLHPAGRRAMGGADWARGRRDLERERLPS